MACTRSPTTSTIACHTAAMWSFNQPITLPTASRATLNRSILFWTRSIRNPPTLPNTAIKTGRMFSVTQLTTDAATFNTSANTRREPTTAKNAAASTTPTTMPTALSTGKSTGSRMAHSSFSWAKSGCNANSHSCLNASPRGTITSFQRVCNTGRAAAPICCPKSVNVSARLFTTSTNADPVPAAKLTIASNTG